MAQPESRNGFVADQGLRLVGMPQLSEALSREDDWTGKSDAAARRKIQNRLNVRAHRRRKAEKEGRVVAPIKSVSKTRPCWIEHQQVVMLIPASWSDTPATNHDPPIPRMECLDQANSKAPPSLTISFPLGRDHLITLLQYNVLRASLTNRNLVSSFLPESHADPACASAALHVLPALPYPKSIPLSLLPTKLQREIPHEAWVDIIPSPHWRDNILRAMGTFDEDDLWSDTIGGLFEGFPHSEIQVRGIIAWWPPWDVTGWELSEGFWRKWKWVFEGCDGTLESTNRWRAKRGESPLRG